MIKLVAFDWNGTLLSDTLTSVRAENKALLAVGAEPITLAKFRQTFEIPIVKYWQSLGFTKAFLKKHFQTIEDVYSLNYEELANKARTRSGVKKVLSWLRAKNINRVIYSNHTIKDIAKHLPRLKIDIFLNIILARSANDNSQLHSRSKDQKLFEFVKKNKIKPSEVISVGDSEEEIEIGKKYGYHSVAITGGWNSTARLKKHRPDFLIHNMKELIGIVKQLNRTGFPPARE